MVVSLETIKGDMWSDSLTCFYPIATKGGDDMTAKNNDDGIDKQN